MGLERLGILLHFLFNLYFFFLVHGFPAVVIWCFHERGWAYLLLLVSASQGHTGVGQGKVEAARYDQRKEMGLQPVVLAQGSFSSWMACSLAPTKFLNLPRTPSILLYLQLPGLGSPAPWSCPSDFSQEFLTLRKAQGLYCLAHYLVITTDHPELC